MISPTEFMAQAEKLVLQTSKPPEVDCRSAVSRAYYSLFHQSLNFLEQQHKATLIQIIRNDLDRIGDLYEIARVRSLDRKYLHLKKVNFHKIISLVLTRINKRNQGRDFSNFRDDRNAADYNLNEELEPDDARSKVKEMRRLINSITF